MLGWENFFIAEVGASSERRQSRENPTPHASPEERREDILRAYEEREPPARAGADRSRVARKTVVAWIKKN